ncbi:MAG: hypothetical protein ACRC3H_24290 [Lachnospiraceae bacterium]
MEWFVIGRDMHVLCHPSTDAPESLPIDDSGSTLGQEILISNNVATGQYDFKTDPDHVDSVHITEGNYISFKDKYSKYRLYTIMTIIGDDEWTVHCEDVGLDLINEDTSVWDLTGSPEPIADTLNRVLHDTGWEIGINEISDRSRATKYEGNTDSQLARIGMICNTFECEADFEIEMTGSKVTKRVLNIYKTLGEDKTQQRFIDDINLIALQYSGSIEDLCTCMRCYGKEVEGTGEKLTIADIEYDDGRYYSPKEHIRIYDRDARNKWSRFRAYDYVGQGEFDGYINGTFEYDTDSAQELFNRGLSELKSRNEKKVAYEATLYDLKAGIGDTVQISDNRHQKKTYLSARVQSVRNHYTVPGEDTGVLANYTLLESNPTSELDEAIAKIKSQLKIVESSEVGYQVAASGTEVPNGDWVDSVPEVQAGSYLWTRIETTYTKGTPTIAYTVGRSGVDGTDADTTDLEKKVVALTENLGKKKDNDYGYGYSNTTADPRWYKIATISKVIGTNSRYMTFVVTRLYNSSSLQLQNHYSAIVSLNVRYGASVYNANESSMQILSSTDSTFALSDYLYVLVDSNNDAHIYCKTARIYDGWRVDQIKDVNTRVGTITSEISYYAYSSGEGLGIELTEPSGTKLLPTNNMQKLTSLAAAASDITLANIAIYKSGEKIYGSFRFSFTSAQTAGAKLVTTLPTGFRPTGNVHLMNSGNHGNSAMCYINSAGEIYFTAATTTVVNEFFTINVDFGTF